MIFAQTDPVEQEQAQPATLQVMPMYPMGDRQPRAPAQGGGGGGGGGGGKGGLDELMKMFKGKDAAAQSLMSDPDPDSVQLALSQIPSSSYF